MAWLLKHLPPRLVWAVSVGIHGFITIGLLALLALATGSPFVFPSLGPTAYLFFFSPLAEASSPRNTILGHAIGLICGYAAFAVTAGFGPTSAGAIPYRRRMLPTVWSETQCPRLANAPAIRSYPQPAFSLAIRRINASVSRSMRGRPGFRRCFEPSNLRATSRRYQARIVSGFATEATCRKTRSQDLVLSDEIFVLQKQNAG